MTPALTESESRIRGHCSRILMLRKPTLSLACIGGLQTGRSRFWSSEVLG